MYQYFIRDDATGMYMIGRMKLGAPVATCVWGERRNDMLVFRSAMKARTAALESGVSSASVYRLNTAQGSEITLKGDDAK